MRDMTLCVWHDSFMCVTRLIHMCDVKHDAFVWVIRLTVCDMTHPCVCDTTHLYVWRETWLIRMGDTTHCVWWRCVWHDLSMYITRLIHNTPALGNIDDTTLCVWHVSLMCVTRLIHICDMTHSQHTCPRQYWWYDSTCVTCLTYVCDTTHAYMCHDSFMTHLLSAILVAKTTLRVPCGAGANAASCSAGGSAA